MALYWQILVPSPLVGCDTPDGTKWVKRCVCESAHGSRRSPGGESKGESGAADAAELEEAASGQGVRS